MRYHLRSDKGTLIAKLSDAMAMKLIGICPGKWVNYETITAMRSAYQFDDDFVEDIGPLTLYIFVGYNLIDTGVQ